MCEAVSVRHVIKGERRNEFPGPGVGGQGGHEICCGLMKVVFNTNPVVEKRIAYDLLPELMLQYVQHILPSFISQAIKLRNQIALLRGKLRQTRKIGSAQQEVCRNMEYF